MAATSRKDFIAAIASTVVQVSREGAILLPSVRLAQCLLETGGVIHPWYNLGGIKANGVPNKYWHGDAVVKGTWEHVDGRNADMKAAFRAYSSVYHYMKDQELLLAKPRYDRVKAAGTPEMQAQMLRVCGYATDPSYESKLISIINQYGLQQYDIVASSAPVDRPSLTGPLKGAAAAPILRNGLVVSNGWRLSGGTVWVPVRKLGESLGGAVGWTGTKATVNGTELDTLLDVRTGYVAVRSLAAALGMQAVWEQQTGTVTLKK
ncbi:glucosaminidase domain-containing protein [Paenibacillus sp. NEAU-GSW1]|uniref:glucosaminidase domain-containing protein n=1 Tax=Paenibacillus sp. NEAU-GSW1 TaxID=2682486 RepID=UPI0012E324DE|nr:glucosaminidase domain-containing protein [Paenibacillus sp. NEAU-GSW1]MUT66302.1 hypothetical protein [Paenibacillus sp. NEAU-GSW1]